MSVATRRMGGLTAGVAIVLTIIWYMALFRPESSHLAAAHRDYAAAQQQVTKLQGQVTSLIALEKQIPADSQRLATYDAAVPSNPDLQDVLAQLHNAAIASGVQLSSVSPAAPPSAHSGSSSSPSGGPPSVQLTMSASGAYGQLMAFITQLTQMPRTVVVNSASIGQGTGGALTATMTATIFYAS